jgi:uncharacterized protein (DUF2336 family)
VKIIHGRATCHRIAAAMRPGLWTIVADALVECADTEAIVCLLHNHEASIAEATMASLISGGPAANAYKAPLAGRGDLPSGLALQLAAIVSKYLQDQLIGRYQLDPIAVRAAGDPATSDAVEDLNSNAEESEDEIGDGRRDVRQMIEMLRLRQWPHFKAAMLRFTGLTPRLIHTVLSERDGR